MPSRSTARPSASCSQNLTTKYGGLKQHLFTADGKLRSFVNIYVNDDDIRYLQKDQTPLKSGDTVSIIPSVAGGAPARRRSDGDVAGAVGRRDQALQPAPDHAGGRRRGSAQAEGREGAVHRRGRARVAGGDVSRRRRRRHHRHRRLRRRRLQQPAAAVAARHAAMSAARSSPRRRIGSTRSTRTCTSRPTKRR